MPTVNERNAAFDAAKAIIIAELPEAFRGYVHDDVILRITDTGLMAAQIVREKTSGTPVLSVPAPSQISMSSIIAHLRALDPIIGVALNLLPPPWNAISQLAMRGISAATDVATAMQTDPASVNGVINSHMDVIGDLLSQIEIHFPGIKPFADAIKKVSNK